MPGDEELRAALLDPTPAARLDAAARLAARSISDELRAAFGLGAVAASAAGAASGASRPSSAQRRLFPMALSLAGERGALGVLAELDPEAAVRAAACQLLARGAAPDDAAAYAALARIATHDVSETVRAAVVSSLRGDAPEHVLAALSGWLGDASGDVERAAVAAVFETSASPQAFLHRLRDEPSARLAYALAFLRQSGGPIAWSDVSPSIVERDLTVLVELARLFAGRSEGTPTALWLRCAKATPELLRLPEPQRVAVLDAAGAACRATTLAALSHDDLDLLDAALDVVAEHLPAVAHESYLELERAGVLADPRATPARPVTSTFGRLWLAMIRLSPHPELYPLRPRYR
jgi:hypothetical protein